MQKNEFPWCPLQDQQCRPNRSRTSFFVEEMVAVKSVFPAIINSFINSFISFHLLTLLTFLYFRSQMCLCQSLTSPN